MQFIKVHISMWRVILWWSVWSNAFAEAVTVAKRHGYQRAEVRVMDPMDDRGEISLFVMINENWCDMVQTQVASSKSGAFEETVTEFISMCLTKSIYGNSYGDCEHTRRDYYVQPGTFGRSNKEFC